MIIYKSQNVFDAALERIEYLFCEFPHVIINFSGGKDSTVLLHLCLMVGEKLGRLPLDVIYIDEEFVWESVVEYVRKVKEYKGIDLSWFQMPLKSVNASSRTDDSLICWDYSRENNWVREKDEDSIKVNDYGVENFFDLFDAYAVKKYGKGEKICNLAGVRAEESPSRLNGLTSYPTYKWITWGKKEKTSNHFTFYPLYDWSYSDIWKAIFENNWEYTRLYDYMFQYGVQVKDMRVSDVIHETAVRNMFFMQEVEPETWNRIINRVSGANSTSHLLNEGLAVKELPYMFRDWKEYRDYLLENLISDKWIKEKFRKKFEAHDDNYRDEILEKLYKTEISAILLGDWEGTKLSLFRASHARYSKNKGKMGLHEKRSSS